MIRRSKWVLGVYKTPSFRLEALADTPFSDNEGLMSTATVSPTSTQMHQTTLMRSSLNSSIMFDFLMGIYTAIYFGTVYLYLAKRSRKAERVVVLSSITLLYISAICIFCLQWYYAQHCVIDHGDTRETMFDAMLLSRPTWLTSSERNIQDLMFVIADALLLWRCFQVWNKSWKMVAVPGVLFIVQIALFITVGVLSTVQTSASGAQNQILATALFASFGTTVVTTSTIGYRICSTTKPGVNGFTLKCRLGHILRGLFEAAGIYAPFIFANAVLIAVQSPSTINMPFTNWSSESSKALIAIFPLNALLIFLAGIIPTILVARVAFVDPQNDRVTIAHVVRMKLDSSAGGYTSSDTQGQRGKLKDIESGGVSDSESAVIEGVQKA